MILKMSEIENAVKSLLIKYHAEYAVLFGSYARGEASSDSDVDLVIYGGTNFNPTDIFSLAEELRETLGKSADVYEISEINNPSGLYKSIMKDGVRIA